MTRRIFPSPLVRERNQRGPPMPVTASAGVESIMCFCVDHATDRTRSRGPLETRYLEAATEAKRMNQAFTASAYRETTADALTAWRASQVLAELHTESAEQILNSLGD